MNRTAALLANMTATIALVDSMIAKAKGLSEPKPQEPKAPLENGSRTYIVSNWMPTCFKCSRFGRCSEEPRECDQVNWFPVFHRVDLTIHNGAVVSITCREGKKAGGQPCHNAKCKHITRVEDVLSGTLEKGVELSMVSRVANAMPKCPNCRERWGISQVGDDFECRNPVCVRNGKSWRFKVGDTARPASMRNDLVIRDREPGRVIRKQNITKRWGTL